MTIGSDLADLVFDRGRPYAYTADRQSDQVHVVSLTSMVVERSIPVGDEPVALTLNPSGTILYVGHAAERTIRAIDVQSWAQVGNLTTAFLTWDLAAPTDGELVATTHDIAYSGEYPYVLGTANGSVLQRLDPGELVYMDFLVALNSTGTRAYLVPSAAAPFVMYTFERDATGTWTFLGPGPDFGSGTPAATDIVVSPDDRWIYVTLAGGIVSGIATDQSASGPVGLGRHSRTADTSPTGHFAVAAGDAATVYTYDVSPATDPGGFYGFPVEPVAAIALSDQPWQLRVSPGGDWIAVIVGLTRDAWQNVEFVQAPSLTFARPLGPAGFTRDRVLDVSARVVDFRTLANLTVAMLLDDGEVPSSFDRRSGFVVSRVGPLSERQHAVEVDAFRGILVAVGRWTFVVDATAPLLDLDPIPSIVESDSLLISGTVVEPNLAWLRVGAAYVNVSGGRFSVAVPLDVGLNSIEVEAFDRAGNSGRTAVTTEFRPVARWFVHPDGHFRIRVPLGWQAEGNRTSGSTTFDVLLTRSSGQVIVGVSHYDRSAVPGDASEIVDRVIADARAGEAHVDVLEPVVDASIDGRPAARAVIAVSIVGFPQVIEIVTVVTGAEWGLSWVLVGAAPVGVFSESRAEIESAMQGFDPFEREGPPQADLALRVLAGSSVAAVLGAMILAALVYGRRLRQKPRAPLPP